MEGCEIMKTCHGFVDARIVFHGARTEGIKTHVHRMIKTRQIGEVTNHFALWNFWQGWGLGAEILCSEEVCR
jgi:hypothetical protein